MQRLKVRLIPGTYNPDRFSVSAPFVISEQDFPFKVLGNAHRFTVTANNLKELLEKINTASIDFWLRFGSQYLKSQCTQDLYQPYVKIDLLKQEVQILTSQGMFDGDKRPVFYFKI